jgi:hypothetical protein
MADDELTTIEVRKSYRSRRGATTARSRILSRSVAATATTSTSDRRTVARRRFRGAQRVTKARFGRRGHQRHRIVEADDMSDESDATYGAEYRRDTAILSTASSARSASGPLELVPC